MGAANEGAIRGAVAIAVRISIHFCSVSEDDVTFPELVVELSTMVHNEFRLLCPALFVHRVAHAAFTSTHTLFVCSSRQSKDHVHAARIGQRVL